VDEAWLNMVRMARDLGDISSLFPTGIKRIWDLPHTLASAIRMGLYYLSFEELPEKERPPRHIWLDPKKMDAHWAQVKADREREMKGQGSINDMPENALLKDMFGPRVNVGTT
jgi:hypothetical protein